jgi:PIF1-like helicase
MKLIRSHNHVTVKAGELANPLVSKDLSTLAETAYDPYNRWGSVVSISIPNSKSFMSSKCLDLLVLSAALEKEPDYFITLTQHNGLEDFLALALTSAFKDRELVFSKCASTGIAGYLIGGSTLYKFLRMDYEYKCAIEKGSWVAISLARTQVIFIDEVSMLTRESFDMLDQKLQEFSSPHNDAAFAGESTILLGDPAQLQPVGKHIWEPQTFGKFQVAVLRECKRQSDAEFIALLNRIRIGEMTWHDFNATLRSRLLLPGQLQGLDMTNGAILYPRKAGKDDYNNQS